MQLQPTTKITRVVCVCDVLRVGVCWMVFFAPPICPLKPGCKKSGHLLLFKYILGQCASETLTKTTRSHTFSFREMYGCSKSLLAVIVEVLIINVPFRFFLWWLLLTTHTRLDSNVPS
jgi:hypothetical protein